MVGRCAASAQVAAILILAVWPLSTARPGTFETKELNRGIAAFNGGSAVAAVRHLTNVIQSPTRSMADLAKAFHYRSKAYLALNNAALGLADIEAAIWLKTLSPIARADAVQVKRQALKVAGLVEMVPDKAEYRERRRAQRVVQKAPVSTATIAPSDPLKPWSTKSVAVRLPDPAGVPSVQTPWITQSLAVTPRSSAQSVGQKITEQTMWPEANIARAPPPAAAALSTRDRKTFSASSVAPSTSVRPKIAREALSVRPDATAKIGGSVVPRPSMDLQTNPSSQSNTGASGDTGKAPTSTSVFSSLSSIFEINGFVTAPPPEGSSVAAAEALARQRRERIRRHNELYASGQIGENDQARP